MENGGKFIKEVMNNHFLITQVRNNHTITKLGILFSSVVLDPAADNFKEEKTWAQLSFA